MSVQIFLLGRITGGDDFLLTPAAVEPESTLLGRASWLSLLSEVLPRALLAELGLSKMLLGTSGGDQFLVVLPEEAKAQSEEFLTAAGVEIARLTGGAVALTWAVTENLGDWTIVRKRLVEELERKRSAPAANRDASFFEPFTPELESEPEYFRTDAIELRTSPSAGWNPEHPGLILPGETKHSWSIGPGLDAIPMARHLARNDDGGGPATAPALGDRAEGRPVWGVLRGDVDDFLIRLRRLQSIEEHIQLAVMYKQFFAGELEVLCSMKDFWRKVSIIYAGGDDFAVFGAWDALLPLARELQRMFHRFSEENLRDFPGAEGKTISMALALAPEANASLASVYEEAGQKLDIAKSADKDCIFVLGRVLEWKQLSDAADLKDGLLRVLSEFEYPAGSIQELCGIYRETQSGTRRQSRPERPWRFHRRVNRILPPMRDREMQRARTAVITDLAGKKPAHLKLRPGGRVALEWARLSVPLEANREAAQPARPVTLENPPAQTAPPEPSDNDLSGGIENAGTAE